MHAIYCQKTNSPTLKTFLSKLTSGNWWLSQWRKIIAIGALGAGSYYLWKQYRAVQKK